MTCIVKNCTYSYNNPAYSLVATLYKPLFAGHGECDEQACVRLRQQWKRRRQPEEEVDDAQQQQPGMIDYQSADSGRTSIPFSGRLRVNISRNLTDERPTVFLRLRDGHRRRGRQGSRQRQRQRPEALWREVRLVPNQYV